MLAKIHEEAWDDCNIVEEKDDEDRDAETWIPWIPDSILAFVVHEVMSDEDFRIEYFNGFGHGFDDGYHDKG